MSEKTVVYRILTEISASSEEEALILARIILDDPKSVPWALQLKNMPRGRMVYDA